MMNKNSVDSNDGDVRKGRSKTAFMCLTSFEDEIEGTSTRLFPCVEAHRSGCPCGKSGTVEVSVTFVRYIKNPKAVEDQQLKEQDLEVQREALKGVVALIQDIKNVFPKNLTDMPGSKGFDMVNFWLERHEQIPNGHALFWALDSLWRLANANDKHPEMERMGFTLLVTEAADLLRNTWTIEVRSMKA